MSKRRKYVVHYRMHTTAQTKYRTEMSATSLNQAKLQVKLGKTIPKDALDVEIEEA